MLPAGHDDLGVIAQEPLPGAAVWIGVDIMPAELAAHGVVVEPPVGNANHLLKQAAPAAAVSRKVDARAQERVRVGAVVGVPPSVCVLVVVLPGIDIGSNLRQNGGDVKV